MSHPGEVKLARLQEIRSVIRVLDGMDHKYDLPAENTSSEKDPNLTIEDMSEKAEIFEKLISQLLPSIKEQIFSLFTSLDINDLAKHPNPDVRSTLKILLKLDRDLQSILASTVSLVYKPLLPHEKHDHNMKDFKMFRCSELRRRIDGLLRSYINALFECCRDMLQFCAVSAIDSNVAFWDESWVPSRRIHVAIPHVIDRIDEIIKWHPQSDWAIIQEDWQWQVASCDQVLELLTESFTYEFDSAPNLANLTIDSIQDRDLIIENEKQLARDKASLERMLAVSTSTLTLLKLTRILIRKILKMIPKKPIFELDTELNSETIIQLRNVFDFLTSSLSDPLYKLRMIHCSDRATIVDKDSIHGLLKKLSTAFEPTLIRLAHHLIPSLYGVEHASAKTDFDAWSLDLNQLWDKAAAYSLHLISALEVEPDRERRQET
ncbi:hypothetical protein Pst134EA_029018 [Puccinia striiformis f. sp. tritici]|uniref:hypothetical protein n=1 Tax=Puccinia striiformis f. sp. tritici TaxID=168172 RepID=UPI002007600D|nr:hypothetical protein Pst134EA_029018 [Puccinia striiformis f. sp. tritici]KAH9447033.1 hypothetical protein Pst134EA_029018 [Puccinia striiformis f. sp. tritici]KAI9630146.1 hypothetical protein KEM48_012176 [Puccinia striiformis f. sp. tritici PST-130]